MATPNDVLEANGNCPEWLAYREARDSTAWPQSLDSRVALLSLRLAADSSDLRALEAVSDGSQAFNQMIARVRARIHCDATFIASNTGVRP